MYKETGRRQAGKSHRGLSSDTIGSQFGRLGISPASVSRPFYFLGCTKKIMQTKHEASQAVDKAWEVLKSARAMFKENPTPQNKKAFWQAHNTYRLQVVAFKRMYKNQQELT